jgi:hypothetical protein
MPYHGISHSVLMSHLIYAHNEMPFTFNAAPVYHHDFLNPNGIYSFNLSFQIFSLVLHEISDDVYNSVIVSSFVL